MRREPRHAARRKNRVANQRWRFRQKTGFGERRCDAKPLCTKIFLLPKTTTQSPREAFFADADESRQHRSRIDRPMRELQKCLRHRGFL